MRIMLTGMSGVGKSAVVDELRRRGHAALDTDRDAYRIAADGEWLWDEDKVERFLESDASALFVAGAASNQVGFYDRVDHVVLLTAPTDVMVDRIRSRTGNPFGQTADELAKILADKELFEPMMRRAADVVIHTDRPLADVVDDIVAVALTAESPDTQPTVVLASASPRRLELLREIGIEPIVEPADLDETLDDHVDVAAAVAGLAAAKARAVAARHAGEAVLVLGADTLVVLDGRPLGKPADDDDARAMLGRLSGREHRVMTGVAIIDAATGSDVGGVETTVVRFRALSPDEIDAYVATGEPLDKAGAYGIQGGAAAFVESLDGDHSNVVGLPLPLVTRMLGQILDSR